MTDEELDSIFRKLELASQEFAEAKHPGKLWEWVLPLCDIGKSLVSEVHRLKATLQRAYPEFAAKLKEYNADDTKSREQLAIAIRADERQAILGIVKEWWEDDQRELEDLWFAIQSRGEK